MTTIIWLIVWLIYETPQLEQWNNWLIALIVCVVIDVLSMLDQKGNL